MPRLRRSNPDSSGYRRRRSGRSWRYVDEDGHQVTDETANRIASLVIPPAWTDVWICPDPLGHIQAVGTDQAGRRQYIYHPAWRLRQDQAKFDRALELALSLTTARQAVTSDLQASGFTQRRMMAAAFRIIDLGSLRVGSEEYLQANGSRGLTTLLCRHARVAGADTILTFPGKSGQRWTSTISDRSLSALIGAIKAERGARSRLLAWHDNSWHALQPAHVNAYIRDQTQGDFTAKDFRTLHGTVVAARSLAETGPAGSEAARKRAITHAISEVAEVLGNTTAVARKSYVDPRVFDRYRSGHVLDLSDPRGPEFATRLLLVG